MMNDIVHDAIIIGAGHAGLSISYFLKKHSLAHLVFERGIIGEAWLNQRWNSFAMNTPNKINVLPGQTYKGNSPDGFGTAIEFVSSLNEYKSAFQLPVKENANVVSITKSTEDENFNISVSEIGSAQSGSQIAEDLAEAGRKVYLSTSMVARVPRRYREKDIVEWLTMMDFFNAKSESVTDPKARNMRVPLLSGIGEFGHTLSYQLLAEKGVTILGKAESADSNNIFFGANASEHIKFGDGFSQKVKEMVDEFIINKQIAAPMPEVDIADIPDKECSCASPVTSLNFKEHNISTIIWSTGFTGDFSYLKLPVFDSDGSPKHKNGLSEINGLYFLGLPWLRMRKSSMIFGINDDAVYIADAVVKNHHSFMSTKE